MPNLNWFRIDLNNRIDAYPLRRVNGYWIVGEGENRTVVDSFADAMWLAEDLAIMEYKAELRDKIAQLNEPADDEYPESLSTVGEIKQFRDSRSTGEIYGAGSYMKALEMVERIHTEHSLSRIQVNA